MIDLSEQQLVDCNNKNWGCNGGWPEIAFAYIRKNGIDTEGHYPYKGTKANCNRKIVILFQLIHNFYAQIIDFLIRINHIK